MRVRDSGMPDEAYWESLFDVPLILDRLGIDGRIGDVLEVGCGYGTFTLPVAARISGRVFAVDIEPAMVRRTHERAHHAGLQNVIGISADVMAGSFHQPAPVDGCLLFNILHGEDPVELLAQAARLVRPGGWVWAIHWRYDPSTPRGPSMDIRPQPEQVCKWARETGVLSADSGNIDLPPWHYGYRFRKPIEGSGALSSW